MIFTAIVWVYIFIISTIYGWLFQKLLSKIFKSQFSFPLALTSINGLILLNWLLSIIHLLFPIGVMVHVLVAIGAITYLWVNRLDLRTWGERLEQQARRLSLLPLLLLALLAFYIMTLTVSTITHSDVGLYHATTIRWFETYPIIPGLGNLHGRLAFNNIWFVLSAFFSLSFLKIQPFYVLNGYLALMFSVFCLWVIFFDQRRGNCLPAILAGLLMTMPMLTLQFTLPSASPDLPVPILIWMVLILILRKQGDSHAHPIDQYSILILVFSVYAITVKLSAGPILLAPAVLLMHLLMHKRWHNTGLVLLVASLMVLPWFVRSYFMSGYLVYPIGALDLFNPDWKIPAFLVQHEADAIHNWSVDRYQINYGKIRNLSVFEWFSFWYQHPSLWKHEDLIATFFPFTILFSVGSLLVAWVRKNPLYITLAYAIGLAGSIFGFFTAPTPRFGVGFLILILFLPLTQVLHALLRIPNRLLGRTIAVFSIILVVVYFSTTSLLDIDALQKRMIVYQAGYPLPSLDSTMLSGQEIFFPAKDSDGLCWYVIPCAYSADVHIEMRGQSLSQGFRYRP